MRSLSAGRLVAVLAPLALLFLAALLICPLLGWGTGNPLELLGEAWSNPTGKGSPDVYILIHLRVPRVVLALLAGGALALAGAAFQGLLRNPLATPYTLGVASGSALAASTAIYLDARFALVRALSLGPISGLQLWGLLGALLTVLLVYVLARRQRHFSMLGLILAGVTLGLIANALILFVRYLSSPRQAVMMDRWLMGSLDVVGFQAVGALLPLLLPGLVLLFAQAGPLNQLAFGEELAEGRGVRVDRLQRTVFFGGSLVTASVVAVTGPIGFVGLIVPHALRRLVGSDHRLLLPASFLGGGAFLAACDVISRTALGATMLPVGVITALLGGPFFLALLVRQR